MMMYVLDGIDCQRCGADVLYGTQLEGEGFSKVFVECEELDGGDCDYVAMAARVDVRQSNDANDPETVAYDEVAADAY